MAYDESLADRLREALATEDGISEQKMFGGLAFLMHGHMVVAASGQGGLMLRVGPSTSPELTRFDGVRPFQMNGRSMNGWLQVAPEVVEGDGALAKWVSRGVEYVRTLPPKY